MNVVERAKFQWESELGINWTEEQWNKLKCVNHSCSKNVNIQENRYKMACKWYLTPERIKMFMQSNGECAGGAKES